MKTSPNENTDFEADFWSDVDQNRADRMRRSALLSNLYFMLVAFLFWGTLVLVAVMLSFSARANASSAPLQGSTLSLQGSPYRLQGSIPDLQPAAGSLFYQSNVNPQ